MPPVRTIVLLLQTLALTGCMSMLADRECRDGNWRDVGRRDGGNGFSPADSWQARCGAFGLTIDAAAYDQGFREGVAQTYCTAESARRRGAKGQLFSFSLCRQPNEELRSAFEQGTKRYCTPQSAYEVGGRNESFASMRMTCSANTEELRRAHQRGVTEVYCRPANAYQAGLKSSPFDTASCPAGAKNAYQLGEEARDIGLAIDRLDMDLSILRDKMSTSLKEGERKRLSWRIDELESERHRLSEQRDKLERRVLSP